MSDSNRIPNGIHAPIQIHATYTPLHDTTRQQFWSPSSIASSYVSARAATEPSDAHQPHATASAWMRADR